MLTGPMLIPTSQLPQESVQSQDTGISLMDRQRYIEAATIDSRRIKKEAFLLYRRRRRRGT
ncbi:hypothetical protein Avbf_00518 [Armadillidium vulgare]|nr:hypothetical protein Avbf_00518 [Armadillidium vulgare]